MQTYTEFLMVKKAGDEDDSYLAQLAARKESGDTKAQEALNTMAPGEFGWGLLGAGLGAGGGYLVSRWLRRNGTKRQRAMDMILGALLGGGGTMLLLNTLPGSHGLTQAEMLRARKLYEQEKGSTAAGATMDVKSSDSAPPEWQQNAKAGIKTTGGALGALVGGLKGAKIGDALLPIDTWLSNIRLKRVANSLGVNPKDFADWRASGPKNPFKVNNVAVRGGQEFLASDPTAKTLKNIGSAANKGIGGAAGGVGGWYLGSWGGSKLADIVLPDKPVGML